MIIGETTPKFRPLITAWQGYINQNNWKDITKNITPKQSDCLVYELGNPLDRPNEDFAIADMRMAHYSEPHFHPDNNYEIYFVLQGTATLVIGGEEYNVNPGDVAIINPKIVHYAIPDKDFVIAVVNTPPFNLKNYIPIDEDNDVENEIVGFNKGQFARLINQ